MTVDVDKISKTGIILIVLLVVLMLSRKVIQNAVANLKENNFDNNIGKTKKGKSINLIAESYRNAMNPSGISWLMWSDGTDEEAILNLAPDTAGVLNDVNKAYKNKYGTSLVDDLQGELSSSDFQKWQQIVTK